MQTSLTPLACSAYPQDGLAGVVPDLTGCLKERRGMGWFKRYLPSTHVNETRDIIQRGCWMDVESDLVALLSINHPKNINDPGYRMTVKGENGARVQGAVALQTFPHR